MEDHSLATKPQLEVGIAIGSGRYSYIVRVVVPGSIIFVWQALRRILIVVL